MTRPSVFDQLEKADDRNMALDRHEEDPSSVKTRDVRDIDDSWTWSERIAVMFFFIALAAIGAGVATVEIILMVVKSL